MLCVRRITLREIRLPLKEPFRISSGVSTERRICLLELESADGGGLTGWSECVAGEQPNYSDETIDTAWFAIRAWVAPRILGRELEAPGEVHGILARDCRSTPGPRKTQGSACPGSRLPKANTFESPAKP